MSAPAAGGTMSEIGRRDKSGPRPGPSSGGRRGLEGLDRHRRRFAPANAERRDAALEPPCAKRRDQRHQYARARGADRVAERAGAAIDVDLLVRKPKVAHRRHGDDCESLVDLEEVDGTRAPAALLEQFLDRADRRGWKILRRGGMGRMRDDPGEGLD